MTRNTSSRSNPRSLPPLPEATLASCGLAGWRPFATDGGRGVVGCLLAFFLGRGRVTAVTLARWCPAVCPPVVAVSASLISTARRRQTQQQQQEEDGQREGRGSAGPPVAGRGAFNSRPQGIRGICTCGVRVSAGESQRGRAGLDVDRRVGPDDQPA